jgi:hypothetical protein
MASTIPYSVYFANAGKPGLEKTGKYQDSEGISRENPLFS